MAPTPPAPIATTCSLQLNCNHLLATPASENVLSEFVLSRCSLNLLDESPRKAPCSTHGPGGRRRAAPWRSWHCGSVARAPLGSARRAPADYARVRLRARARVPPPAWNQLPAPAWSTAPARHHARAIAARVRSAHPDSGMPPARACAWHCGPAPVGLPGAATSAGCSCCDARTGQATPGVRRRSAVATLPLLRRARG